MKDISISTSEWEIMRVLWVKEEVTSREVYELLGKAKSWQPSTIKTLLKRLVDKNLVKITKLNNKYIYSPLLSSEDSLELLSQDLLARICPTKTSELLSVIINNTQLRDEDIELLKKVLIKKDTVSKINCNCLPGQCLCEKE